MNKDIEVMKKAKQMELARLKLIAEGRITDNGPDDCPYCKLFIERDCEACPIKIKTGYTLCRLSPYMEFARHQSEAHFVTEPPYRIECAHCKELIKNVYDYTAAAPLANEDQLNIELRA